MGKKPKTSRIRLRNLSQTGIIIALTVGILLPVLLSTAVGIVSLALGEESDYLVVAVLIISFTAAAIGGAITVSVLLSRRARLVRLQADLLANVTHELRSPLSSIRMYAQTLLMGRLEQDANLTQESLETIIRETEWLETMIERVLTWRAAAKDRESIKLNAASINNGVEDALARFARMVAHREVQVDSRLESTSLVRHDPAAICTLVLNLLTNAYKYTLTDKKVAVRTSDRNGLAVIEVEDNGIGIPQREQRRIFDPFYRVDQKIRSKASGTGLGLAIVRYLVQAHGGEIDVESTRGQGSRFIVSLPVVNG